MTTKQSSTSTLVVIDFNDVVVVTTPYSLGNVLFEYIKSNTKFDWGEIRVEFSDLNFENIKVLTKEYNNISEEPATILIEKLLLLDNYNTNKTILLVIESIDDIIVKKLFYEKLLKDTLAIPSPNNLNINTIEHNNRILTEFEIYLKEYYPNISGQYLHDVISYFKMIVSWTPNNGYSILSNFDNKTSQLIHKYINYKSTKWIDLVYGETSYTKFIYPLYSLYSKLKSSGNNIKLLTLADFLSSPDHLNITKDDFISLNNILNEYNVDMRLQKYISKSLNVVYKTNDYQRDLKLYKQIVDDDSVSVNVKPWCPIFIIPTNGNLVITTTKIASSFLIKNYRNSNDDNHQPLADFDRSLFSFNLGHTSKLTTTSEDLGQHNILQKYNDIISNSDDGVIYILYRTPFDRYIQSLYQDLSEYIREIHSTNGNDGVLNLYSTFIENSPNDEILMKNLKQLFKEIDNTYIPIPSNLAKDFPHIDKIDDIIKNIIDGLIKYFFTQGFLERDSENDIPISNIYSNTSRFNVLTPHYTPYLTNVLDLYNNSRNKLKIKFVDVDSENIINTILDKDTSNISEDEANITPVDFKKMWKVGLVKYLTDNSEINQSINQALNSDLIAYNSIKNLKNNNQIQNQEFKTSYISNEVSIQLTDINNNIVITTQKIASSWLIHNYAKLNTDISEISDEFASILNNKYRGIFQSRLNIINGAIEFSPPPIESFNEKEREELTIIQNRKSTLLTNILQGNHTGNIYILYRNPEYRYITAVKEDINTYLHNINNTNPRAIIKFYLSFIKDLPPESYVIYEKLIYDMENYHGNNYLGGIFNLTTYVHHINPVTYPHVESFYSIILNGILHWFFNGRGPSSKSTEDPFGEVVPVENTDDHTPITFRNYITQHYTPYLSQMLNYYNSMGQPSYIHFLDIDTEDINDIILNKSDKDNKPNKTPDSLKDKWKLTFDKHLKSNNHARELISNHLMPDVIAYNNIKNIKK